MSLNQLERFSWTDDSGSGLDGTIINNTQLQKIFDAVDAAIGLSVKIQGSAYTALVTDDLLKVTGGSFVINLYTAVGYDGRQLDVVNVGTGTVTLDGFGAQTIGGLATWAVPPKHAIRIKSDGANWLIVSYSVAGVARECLWVPVTAFRPLPTGGSAWPETIVAGSAYDYVAAAFDPTTQEAMSLQFAFPKAWDRGSIQFTPHWTNAAGGTGDVIWSLAGAAIGNNEPLAAAPGTPGYISQPAYTAHWLTALGLSSVVVIGGTPAVGDLCRLVLSRVAVDGLDTYAADALLLGVVLWFSTNARSDD